MMRSEAVKASRVFFLLSLLVVLTFLWRFFVPAHEESDTNLMIGFEILLELAAAAGLVVLFFLLMSRSDEDLRRVLVVTFCVAFVASLGILLMRFSTTAGWYTGHRIYHPGYGSLMRTHDDAGLPKRIASSPPGEQLRCDG
jgi:hypothetical protein